MAQTIDEIFSHIYEGNNFILKGGAGSGKTYTLIEVLKRIYTEDPAANVACITFTNVAVNEIKERAPFKRLKISTIHDFLWDTIKSFQPNIKQGLLKLTNNSDISYYGDEELSEEYLSEKKIKYREWRKLNEGVISHDEVIAISRYLFDEHKLLSDIVKDKFDYILIDEYQDTFEEVIDILLEHLKKSDKNISIGLFGDSMQSIYRNRVGNVEDYIDQNEIQEIQKEDNRRNPEVIVELINKLRDDNLVQKTADDSEATNYGIEGGISFLFTDSNDFEIEEITDLRFFDGFDFDDANETKELYLSHNLIADKVGFPTLIEIYTKDRILQIKDKIRRKIRDGKIDVDKNLTFGEIIDKEYDLTKSEKKFVEENPSLYQEAREYPYKYIRNIYLNRDQLIGEKKSSKVEEGNDTKRDTLINHLFQIQDCVHLYKNAKHNEFIKKTHYPIKSVADKKKLKESVDELTEMGESSIEEVIEFADSSGIWKKDDRFNNFVQNKEYIYKRVREVKFKEVINLYNYVEAYTPYSTQHNIKGAEFDSVFVVLDNGGWNMYNFEYLFEGNGKNSVIERTQKLFYVCCSRAKKNLVVLFQEPSEEVLETASAWFGEENVHELAYD
ncbi:DNA helicase-2 / ATP-dependent DNA helicase PcrA [Fodinibius roseus]|uniref:DNA helicase-2 / ATP-dependent DNA helicase PcrA n=1 Tax=Fodinibius roseus TaxID=1194090 RepID=A0A1M5LR84_9BACT|nr:UvrD-helicase domain-containing protein [Fodinibius roseus]SHG67662.1 DNA helicase-2 / ATP-dependent DNA helicase PcrA [Fodinibius roseus]